MVTQTAQEPVEPARLSTQDRSAWRVPIAPLLGVSIGALVLVAAASVLAISLWSGVQSTVHLLEKQAVFAVETIEQRLDDHLSPAEEQLDFINDQIVAGRLDPSNDRQMEDVLTGALAATPQVDGIVFIDLGLRMRGVLRSGGGGYWIDEDHSVDPDFVAFADSSITTGNETWGDIVWSRSLDVPVQGVRKPVIVNGQFIGFLGAGVSIQKLSRFVANFETAFGSRVFILRGREQVLAHPAQAEGDFAATPSKPLPTIDEVGDPVLASIWSQDGNTVENLPESATQIREVEIGGEGWFVLYREIASYGSVPWVVGSYFRGSDLEEEFDRLKEAAIAGVVVVVFAIVAAFLIGRRIAGPVHRLATSARRIGALEFDDVAQLAPSRMRELDEAAGAFNLMLGGLRLFESYVPRKLVRRLMGDSNRTLVSEERDVTVMFTDIAGFTTLAEHLPPGETADFLNRHFASITACVEAEGGTVDKYIGDAVMAFWGAPELQPDHALRACHAGQAIAVTIAADNAQRRARGAPAVRLRIGLHTGSVVIGNIGAPDRVNYTIVGDTVNTCQRIEALGKSIDTQPNEDVVILMSEATLREIHDGIGTESVGRHALKGRSGELEVFRLKA
jgi:class 3 adenylate cyclase